MTKKQRKNLTQRNMPHLSPSELEKVRRLLKNRKEKERRKEINTQIERLSRLIGVKSSDKITVLKLTVDKLTTLQHKS